MATAPPFVGPRERDRSARPFLEGSSDVHRGDRGLSRLALADAVRTSLGQQQRLVAGNVLEPCKICPELVGTMQVDVEGANIEEGEIEEFSGWKIDVRQQGVW